MVKTNFAEERRKIHLNKIKNNSYRYNNLLKLRITKKFIEEFKDKQLLKRKIIYKNKCASIKKSLIIFLKQSHSINKNKNKVIPKKY